jgi:hypothetical protein
VTESRYGCMVWYDAALECYVAISPEWGAEAVGLGPSRGAALAGLEALVANLEREEESARSAADGHSGPPARTAAPLATALEWERARRASGAGIPPHEVVESTWASRRRRLSLTPT